MEQFRQRQFESPEMTYKKLLFANKKEVSVKFSLTNIKAFISDCKSRGDKFVVEQVNSLSDDSLDSLISVLGYIPKMIIPNILYSSVYEEKKRRFELKRKIETENRIISDWIAIKKQLLRENPYLHISTGFSREQLLRDFEIYKLCIAEIRQIQPVKIISVQTLYSAIPASVITIINRVFKWDDVYCNLIAVATAPSGADTEEILRRYIVMASKSLFGYDLARCVIVEILKRLLDVTYLPIPSITTLYLMVLWSAMLIELSNANNCIWSSDDVIGLSLALVAMLQQVINRGPIVSLIKKVYETPIMINDLVKRMPPDLRNILGEFLNVKLDAQNYIEALTNISTTWHHALGDLTGVDNLTISKALDMLYTYRIGSCYIDCAMNNKGLSINSFSQYWGNYGPLPKNRQQIEDMLDLFRSDTDVYEERINEIYKRYLAKLSMSSPYSYIIDESGKVYDEIAKLNISYYPSTYELTESFEIRQKFDHPLIYMIAGKIKVTLSSNLEIQFRSQEIIASDIFNAIDNYIKSHV